MRNLIIRWVLAILAWVVIFALVWVVDWLHNGHQWW